MPKVVLPNQKNNKPSIYKLFQTLVLSTYRDILNFMNNVNAIKIIVQTLLQLITIINTDDNLVY